MKSPVLVLFAQHVIALTLLTSGVLYFAYQSSGAAVLDVIHLIPRLFLGIFSGGALALGFGGVCRPLVVICRYLKEEMDLNEERFRVQLQRLIFYVAEIFVAIVALGLTGILKVTL